MLLAAHKLTSTEPKQPALLAHQHPKANILTIAPHPQNDCFQHQAAGEVGSKPMSPGKDSPKRSYASTARGEKAEG